MTNRSFFPGLNGPIALVASLALHLLPFATFADGAGASETAPVTLVGVAGVASAGQDEPALAAAVEDTVDATADICRPIRRLGGKVSIKRRDCAP